MEIIAMELTQIPATITSGFRFNRAFAQKTAQAGAEVSRAVRMFGQEQIERMPR